MINEMFEIYTKIFSNWFNVDKEKNSKHKIYTFIPWVTNDKQFSNDKFQNSNLFNPV